MRIDDSLQVVMNQTQVITEQLLAVPELSGTRSETYLLRILKQLDRLRGYFQEDFTTIAQISLLSHDMGGCIAIIYTSSKLIEMVMTQSQIETLRPNLRELNLYTDLLRKKAYFSNRSMQYQIDYLLQSRLEVCIDLDCLSLIDSLLDTAIDLRLEARWSKLLAFIWEDLHHNYLTLNIYWQTLGQLEFKNYELLNFLLELISSELSVLENEPNSIDGVSHLKKLTELIRQRLVFYYQTS